MTDATQNKSGKAIDPQETREWMDALSAVIDREGADYAHQLIEELLEHARESSIDMPFSANTGTPKTKTTAATACSFKATSRPASTPAPTSKAASPKSNC